MRDDKTERFLIVGGDRNESRGVVTDMSRRRHRRDNKSYNPRSVRSTLNNQDFLSKLLLKDPTEYTEDLRRRYAISSIKAEELTPERIEEIRGNTTFIYVIGNKLAGKSKLRDRIYAGLSEEDYSVLPLRASKDASESDTAIRRQTLKRQEKGEVAWVQAVEALRNEGLSALEKKALPFLMGTSKRKAVLFDRHPLIDTLVKQYLEGANLESVAQYLRGRDTKTETELSCYIKPDIVILLTCNPREIMYREIMRSSHSREGISDDFGSDFLEKTEREKRAYLELSGINPNTGKMEPDSRIYPCRIFRYEDTSNSSIDYKNEAEARRKLEEDGIERTSRIFNEVILPNMNKGGQKNGRTKPLGYTA